MVTILTAQGSQARPELYINCEPIDLILQVQFSPVHSVFWIMK